MKVILEKDYDYIGITPNGWHEFMSKPKPNFDPEIIQVPRARIIRIDGESWYVDLVRPSLGTTRA